MKNNEVDYINMRRLATRSLYNNLMPDFPMQEYLSKENDLKYMSDNANVDVYQAMSKWELQLNNKWRDVADENSVPHYPGMTDTMRNYYMQE